MPSWMYLNSGTHSGEYGLKLSGVYKVLSVQLGKQIIMLMWYALSIAGNNFTT